MTSVNIFLYHDL